MRRVTYVHNARTARAKWKHAQRENSADRREKKINQVLERLEIIPQQIRRLGGKVDDITESVSDPRVRDLLGRLLALHDLIWQMERSTGQTGDTGNYRVLREQVVQVLQLNGIDIITQIERFDPALHKAVEIVPCVDESEDGKIVSVFRDGFQSQRAVLRYAEVVVKKTETGGV